MAERIKKGSPFINSSQVYEMINGIQHPKTLNTFTASIMMIDRGRNGRSNKDCTTNQMLYTILLKITDTKIKNCEIPEDAARHEIIVIRTETAMGTT